MRTSSRRPCSFVACSASSPPAVHPVTYGSDLSPLTGGRRAGPVRAGSSARPGGRDNLSIEAFDLGFTPAAIEVEAAGA